ncbi:MAG: hypothetical protein AAGJ83_14500 [Planctomycetota bacterium]
MVNPYQPLASDGTTAKKAGGSSTTEHESRNKFRIYWAGLAVGNAVVPGILASAVVEGASTAIGVMLGVATFIIGGWWVGSRSEEIRKGLISGGTVLALSQLLPIAQLIAGIFAVGITDGMGLSQVATTSFIESLLSGYVCTLVTGGLLMLPTMFIGTIFVLVSSKSEPPQAIDP